MDTELLGRAKIQDIEREMRRIRLVNLAVKAGSTGNRPAPVSKLRAAPAMPLRLLRALRPAS